MPEIIFKGQTRARLILDTDVDFSQNTVSVVLIKWQKPDGTLGQWTAAVLLDTDGTIFVDFTSLINFDQSGRWRIWSHAAFADGRIAPGQEYIYNVCEEGKSMG